MREIDCAYCRTMKTFPLKFAGGGLLRPHICAPDIDTLTFAPDIRLLIIAPRHMRANNCAPFHLHDQGQNNQVLHLFLY
jgi:hypothetical protein